MERFLWIERRLPFGATQGQVPGLARFPGESQADDLRSIRVDAGCLEINRETFLCAQLFEELLELLGRVDQVIMEVRLPLPVDRFLEDVLAEREQLSLDRGTIQGLLFFYLLFDLRPQRPDLVGETSQAPLLEMLQQPGRIPGTQPPAFPVHVKLDIDVQRHQLAADQHLLCRGAQRLLLLGARHLVDIGEDVVERAEFLQQLGCRFDADARHARHVVHGVADQRLEVDDLLRLDAPVRDQARAIEHGMLAHAVDLDAVADELPAILIAAHDEDVQAALACRSRDGGNDIVGLEAFHAEHRNAHGLQHLLDHGDLQLEVVGHGRSLGLVGWVNGVAKGLAGHVEDGEQVRGLLLRPQVKHVARETEQGIGRQAGRAAHLRDRMKDLKDERMRIYQIHRAARSACGHVTSNLETKSTHDIGTGPCIVRRGTFRLSLKRSGPFWV